MDYEEFVVQFRARAAVRMEEFEKALAKAQEDTANARKQTQPTAQVGTGVPAHTPENNKTQIVQPLGKQIQPARGRVRGRGQVQSILRKA